MSISRTVAVIVATLAVVGSGAALAAAATATPDDRGGLTPRDARVEPGDDRGIDATPSPAPTDAASPAATPDATPSSQPSPEDSGTPVSGRDLPRDQRFEPGDDRRVQGAPAGTSSPSADAGDDDSADDNGTDDSDRTGSNSGSDDSGSDDSGSEHGPNHG